MNISTYESRIKALEDQLNPPAPSGGGDIESISISPDFGGINAKLAAMMPLRWEDGSSFEGAPAYIRKFEITIDSDEAPEQPEQVSMTWTPSGDNYAFAMDLSSQPPAHAFGGKGEPLTATMQKLNGSRKLFLNFGAADANSEEAASRVMSVIVQIDYTATDKTGGEK